MKTKETSVCHKCGGNGKSSKGIMNFHNIQISDKSKEFETKLIDCIKCESCGHSWIPNKSTREQALVWWNSINGTLKQKELGDNYCKTRPFSVFNVPLTGREIEKIYKSEILDKIDYQISDTEFVLKPNQKQFKQFNESLFKAYISKFSDEDKLKSLSVLLEQLAMIYPIRDIQPIVDKEFYQI